MSVTGDRAIIKTKNNILQNSGDNSWRSTRCSHATVTSRSPAPGRWGRARDERDRREPQPVTPSASPLVRELLSVFGLLILVVDNEAHPALGHQILQVLLELKGRFQVSSLRSCLKLKT